MWVLFRAGGQAWQPQPGARTFAPMSLLAKAPASGGGSAVAAAGAMGIVRGPEEPLPQPQPRLGLADRA
eukprot:scaffold7213_cov118-Isochrysis_galbana.AAC.4